MKRELRVVIPGSVRSKKNSKRVFAGKNSRRPIVIPSTAYNEWQRAARLLIAQNPTDNDVSVEAHIYYRGSRPDLSGALESIGDALEGFVWKNDRQIVSWDGSRLYHDKNNPRTELIIRWEE